MARPPGLGATGKPIRSRQVALGELLKGSKKLGHAKRPSFFLQAKNHQAKETNQAKAEAKGEKAKGLRLKPSLRSVKSPFFFLDQRRREAPRPLREIPPAQWQRMRRLAEPFESIWVCLVSESDPQNGENGGVPVGFQQNKAEKGGPFKKDGPISLVRAAESGDRLNRHRQAIDQLLKGGVQGPLAEVPSWKSTGPQPSKRGV